jgi:Cleft lip and palate transmembrane protein 1 (CLPTM1)
LTMGLSMAESMFPGGELDEFRYWLGDERLYRFFVTQIISFVHVWLDYLAFSDEVRFYRGKENFAGVSVSSVVTRLLCSIIIFLYLLDGGGTSWVILLSVFSGVAVDSWKAFKLLRPTFQLRYPFVAFRVIKNPTEQTTAQYDRIAIKYLAMFLYPLVIGWAIYALKVRSFSYTARFGSIWPLQNMNWHLITFLSDSSALCVQVLVFLAH